MRDISTTCEGLIRIHEIETNPALCLAVKGAGKTKFQITANVREILSCAEEEVSALNIKDALTSRGWEAENCKNPLAVVQKILRRLVANNDVVVSETGWGKYYEDRRRFLRRQTKDREQRAEKRAALKSNLTARAEIRALIAEPCREILRAHPDGISARRIGWELHNGGINMSCFNRKASPVAKILATMPDVKKVLVREPWDGPIRNYYYLVQESKNNVRART